MSSKIVEISLEDFEKLVKLNKDKSAYIAKLERANKAYTQQIKIYKELEDELQSRI